MSCVIASVRQRIRPFATIERQGPQKRIRRKSAVYVKIAKEDLFWRIHANSLRGFGLNRLAVIYNSRRGFRTGNVTRPPMLAIKPQIAAK